MDLVNVLSPEKINSNEETYNICILIFKRTTTYLLLHNTPTQKQPEARNTVDIIKYNIGNGISPAER
jgi:hypothetical protein